MTKVSEYVPQRQAFIWSSCKGFHYVKYNDGGVSGLMNHSTAWDYAKMFGGKVMVNTECDEYKRDRLVGSIIGGCVIFTLLFLFVFNFTTMF